MNLKFLITLILIPVFSVSLMAQEEDGWSAKTYRPGEFTKIRLDGGFKVNLIQGDECSVKVKATNEDVFENIKIEKFNNDVLIKMDMAIFEYRRVSLDITFKSLEQLDIEGGVNLKTNGYLDLENFKVDIEGGANIDLELKANRVEVYGEGGFLFELNGVANELDVTVKGAGHVSAAGLKTKDVDFKVAGFGTGTVYATKTLNAKIEGVGKLRYKGDPRVTQYIDGLGSVKGY